MILKSTNVTHSYPESGELPIQMTNDLFFHYLLQDYDEQSILKGIISSFYDIPFEEIISAQVENPISYGEDISSKEMILDVKTLLNDNQIINLEMQVINYKDWPERSLSYLCRCFDNLHKGQGYLHIKGAYHIGFLDYSLFPDEPEFYATYSIKNNKTSRLYTSKFGVSVVDLSKIELASDDDKIHHRDLWASFFKATTWEEINMLATQDTNINNAAIRLNHLVEDQKIRDQIWARQDQLRREIDMRYFYETEIEKTKAELNEKNKEIERLKQELEKYKK